jgi:hypothetical protein
MLPISPEIVYQRAYGRLGSDRSFSLFAFYPILATDQMPLPTSAWGKRPIY